MLLTKQQEYMLDVLGRLGCVRTDQLARLLQRAFSLPDPDAAVRITAAALRQLRHGNTGVRLGGAFAYLEGQEVHADRLDAMDVMLELASGALLDFAAAPHPVLLRFVVQQKKAVSFAVVRNGNTLPPRFLPHERVIILLTKGEHPAPFSIANPQIFAVKQEDGVFRFLTKKIK